MNERSDGEYRNECEKPEYPVQTKPKVEIWKFENEYRRGMIVRRMQNKIISWLKT